MRRVKAGADVGEGCVMLRFLKGLVYGVVICVAAAAVAAAMNPLPSPAPSVPAAGSGAASDG